MSSPSAARPPTLYRHALECIFFCLNIDELGHAGSVCRSWVSAITTMAPIGASVHPSDASKILARCPRHLLRHFTTLRMPVDTIDQPELQRLTAALPNVTKLICWPTKDCVRTAGGDAQTLGKTLWPKRLTFLRTGMPHDASVEDFDALLLALPPTLTHLELRLRHADSRIALWCSCVCCV